MLLNRRDDLVDCCVLIIDTENRNGAYSYSVSIPEIEETKKFIEATFAYYGEPCKRVYIAGFNIVSKNFVWTNEKIAEHIKMVTSNNQNLMQNKILQKRI